ncbi:MAG: DUF4249 domain-containing protein [Saprospiraceae bacterium]|nr:DUF4249 domain-containing protein [Saprospiraceae bacterium]
MKTPSHNSRLWSALLLLVLGACNLDQPIDLQLPEYESRLVVECYLEKGQPFGVLLTRSSGYFEPFGLTGNDLLSGLLESGASVKITHGTQVYQLENKLTLDRFTGKFFNYSLDLPVPENYDDPFELEIVTEAGDLITAKAHQLPVVPIDSVVVEYQSEEKELARVLTYFTDLPDQTNFYRRMIHESSLDSLPIQDFTTSDRVVEDVVVFGTGYDFESGDSIVNTIYHISEDYYNFLESVQGAIQANGNPFAQPSPIISNIESEIDAFGIFTTINYDRKLTIIP